MNVRMTVIGGGLMGRLMALGLVRAGHLVALHDAGDPEGRLAAAHVAAAMIAPLAESMEAEACVIALGIQSLGLWPELLATLKDPVFFEQKGTLVVWHPQDREEARRFGLKLKEMSPAIPESFALKTLDPDGLAALEPALKGRFQSGFFLPGEAQLDNRGLLLSLSRTLDEALVEVHWASRVEPRDFEDQWVIDCRGFGAKADLSRLRGVRGEVLRVESRELALTRPIRLLHPRYPIYIAPKPHGQYVIGATQIESEDASPVSVRSALELLSALYAVHPGFAEARILEMSTQLRPALPHHAPEILWDGGKGIRINGLYRHGYLVAPALMQAALNLIARILRDPEGVESWCRESQFPSLYRFKEAA